VTWNEAANSYWFWALVIGGLAVLYFLPTIIGAKRNIEHLAIIVMLNMFPLAWPGALAGAFMLPRKQPPVLYYAHYTPPVQHPPPGTGQNYW
jgi:hypothetical protein